MSKTWSIAVALCLSAAVSAIEAQDVFVLPGSASPNTNVIVASAANLSSLGAFNAGAGSFQVLATPDGAKFYVISGSGVLSVVDAAFTSVRQIAALPQSPSAATITPDGRRLLVAAGRLYIFDTATDAAMVSNGLDVGSSSIDVAVSLDGSRAFVVGTQPNGFGLLTAVDLTTNTTVGQVITPGSLAGVSVGPNSYVYVTAGNFFQEFYPATLGVTPMGNIALSGRPGKLAFTPDGRFALAGNLDLRSAVAVFQFDLINHTLLNTVPSFSSSPLDKILVAGNNTAYAYSTTSQNLYQLAVATNRLTIAGAVIPGINANQISSVTLSDDLPVGDSNVAQSLFLVSNGTLFRVDVGSSLQTGQFTVGNTGGAISFAGAASTAAPANLYAYNVNQTVQPGGTSAPIVIRVLDANGRPVKGVQVSFATSSGASIQNSSVTTGFDGFASTVVTAPSTAGSGVVTATAGGLTQNFNFVFGTPGPGGGGAGDTLTILSGQGQILFEQFIGGGGTASTPLVVVLKDSSGAPVPSTPVTFTLTQGSGSINGSPGNSGASISESTNANGIVSVTFSSTNFQPGTGYTQAVIAATSSGSTVTFFASTVPSDKPAIVQFVRPQAGQTLVGPVGGTLPGAVMAVVVSSQGIAIPNVNVHIDNDPGNQNPVNMDSGGNPVPQSQHNPHVGPTANAPTVECAGGFALTDAKGQVSCDLVFGTILGSSRFAANVGYIAGSPLVNFTVTVGPPGLLTLVSGNNQTGGVGQQLASPVVVKVTDAGGNLLPDIKVVFQVVSGSATLSNISNSTDASGNAQATVTLGNTPGPGQIKVTAANLTKNFNFVVTVAAGKIDIVSGNAQSTLINTAFTQPLVVKVTDLQGKAVAAAQVAFSVTSGSATVGTPSATTDANGLASTTVRAGANAGPITVLANAGGVTTSFSLSSRLTGPSGILFFNGASFQQDSMSPGSILVIQGTRIATGIQGVVVPANSGAPMPTILAGVQVKFNGIAAPIYAVSNINGAEQVNVQVPFEVPPGPTTITIMGADGNSSTLTNVQVKPFSPGIFQTRNFGPLQAVILHADGTFVTPQKPAQGNEIVKMFVTGMGQVSPSTSTNAAGTGGQTIVAFFDTGVNDAGVRTVSSEYTPGLVGVYTITFQIPLGATPGPARPLGLVAHDSAGNTYAALAVNIPIQ